jgi:hypothetical protein
MKWKPKRISANPAETEHPKPAEPRFVGFEGATSAESAVIEAGAYATELAGARSILKKFGVRIMSAAQSVSVGVWSDLDGPELRAALADVKLDRLPLRYLDSRGVPLPYKVRAVEGDPIPLSVLLEMERQAAEPWKIRDRMLSEMCWQRKVQRGPK